MAEQSNPNLEINSEALYLQRHTGSPVLGRVVSDSGKDMVVQTSTYNEFGSIHVSEPHHPTEVFSLVEAASVVEDLLPTPADGEERLLRDALNEITSHPDKSHELTIRLAGKALVERFSMSPTDKELGIVSKDELVGSLSKYGSNAWKVNDLLEGIQNGLYSEGTRNELNLARPNRIDLSLMPSTEAARVLSEINDTNRTALNELYENYYVDFSKASVWEKTDGAYHSRKTVYPTASGLFSFVETHLSTINSQSAEKSLTEAMIVVGIPTDLPDQGFSPAI